MFINYWSGWTVLKSSTCSELGEENKNHSLSYPLYWSYRGLCQGETWGFVFISYVIWTHTNVKRNSLHSDLPLLSGRGDCFLQNSTRCSESSPGLNHAKGWSLFCWTFQQGRSPGMVRDGLEIPLDKKGPVKPLGRELILYECIKLTAVRTKSSRSPQTSAGVSGPATNLLKSLITEWD